MKLVWRLSRTLPQGIGVVQTQRSEMSRDGIADFGSMHSHFRELGL
jgi:hypothetical protein